MTIGEIAASSAARPEAMNYEHFCLMEEGSWCQTSRYRRTKASCHALADAMATPAPPLSPF
jgi:hypothetical protein